MSEAGLKAILALDGKTRRYSSAGHNLSAEKAAERADQLRNKGVQVSVLDQASRHRGHGYKHCQSCQNAAENLSPQPLQDPAETAAGGADGEDA
jgi:hypothetical protein